MEDFAGLPQHLQPSNLPQKENVLSSPMAAGLLLKLKEECEAQYARAARAASPLQSCQQAFSVRPDAGIDDGLFSVHAKDLHDARAAERDRCTQILKTLIARYASADDAAERVALEWALQEVSKP